MADNSILIRLDGLKLKYEEIGQKLTDPEVIADVKQFVQLTKEYKELEPIVETSDRYRKAVSRIAEADVADYDLIFQNIMVHGDVWTVIDYEWTFEKKISADFCRDFFVYKLVIRL